MTPEPKLAPVEEYLQVMEPLRYLSGMQKDQRDALLRELYDLARRKAFLESWSTAQRDRAPDLRKWRQFVQKAQPRLRAALKELKTAGSLAATLPKQSVVEIYFDGREFSDGIIQAAERLQRSIDLADELDVTVATLIHPSLRKQREKKLVKEELIEHDFSVKPKSSSLDHWFIVKAAERLDKYRDAGGKKITHYDEVISKLFEGALGQRDQSAVSVTAVLRRKGASKAEPKPAADTQNAV